MIDLPAGVVGFHGSSRAAVPHLLSGDIQPSDQHFEWLGTGFYLWQDSPWRAQARAVDRFGEEAALIAARVSLDGCLDLLNPYWQGELADADDQYVAECLADGRDPAQNRPGGNRARDCAVINWYCERAASEGLHVRSVRAIFEEGDPIFEASAIRALSHVQIDVRDPSVSLRSRRCHGEARRPDHPLQRGRGSPTTGTCRRRPGRFPPRCSRSGLGGHLPGPRLEGHRRSDRPGPWRRPGRTHCSSDRSHRWPASGPGISGCPASAARWRPLERRTGGAASTTASWRIGTGSSDASWPKCPRSSTCLARASTPPTPASSPSRNANHQTDHRDFRVVRPAHCDAFELIPNRPPDDQTRSSLDWIGTLTGCASKP